MTSAPHPQSAPTTSRLRDSRPNPLALGCVALLLLLAVAVIYGGAASHALLDYDDDRYVYANPDVVRGATPAAVAAAFTTPRFGAWHPLTTVSHQLIWTFWRDDPAPHHLLNIALHAANCLLVLMVFLRLTGSLGWSASIALLFAVHPLHVESVAWVTERKDVLSLFFGLLSLLAYLRYIQRPGPARMLLVAAALCLALLSKPMLVTLPFVFLLLDYWPLNRHRTGTHASIWPLVAEKWPLFALSLATAVTTTRVHAAAAGAENPTEIPWLWRLVNAPLAYLGYLGKAFWPVDLACFYPHPALTAPEQLHRHAAAALAAALLIAGITALAAMTRRSRPWLLVGWLWFLGTLIPVIGLVQVGHAAMADRFFYLPSIGIYLIVATALRELALRSLAWRWVVVAGAVVVVSIATGLARRQAAVWQSDRALFEHALAITERNALAHNNLGIALGKAGELTAAEREFRAAIAIDAARHDYYYNLGFALERQSKLPLAADAYTRALERDPDDFDSHYQLGATYGKLGDYDRAAHHYARALALRPSHPEARRFLDQARRLKGRGEGRRAPQPEP